MKKIFNFLIFAFIFFIIGFSAGQGWKTPEVRVNVNKIDEKAVKTATLSVDYQDGRFATYKDLILQNKETALSLLKRVAAEEGFALREGDEGEKKSVAQIGNAADNGGENSWKVYVNGLLVEKSADQVVVEAGDYVEWQFMKNIIKISE